MLNISQLEWLEDFADYFKDNEYISDGDYVEAIRTLLDAYYYSRHIFADTLNDSVEKELEKIYDYIYGKYESYEETQKIKVMKWRRRPKNLNQEVNNGR